jgi:hypothetical protein
MGWQAAVKPQVWIVKWLCILDAEHDHEYRVEDACCWKVKLA